MTHPFVPQNYSPRLFKLMNYNILYGFHKMVNPPLFEPDRKRLAQEVVRLENPDILILTEACFGVKNDKNILLNYQEIFGFPHMVYGSWGGEWGNVVLSRFPLSGYTVPLVDRTALTTSVSIDGVTLGLDVIQPHPDTPEDKVINAIRRLIETKSRPYILTGDFNALSDEDVYDREVLVKGFTVFRGFSAVAHADKLLSRKLIPFVKSYGLVDAIAREERTYTVPTDFCTLEKIACTRIDHIFISTDLESVSSRVVKNASVEYASDHYPIVCTLRLKCKIV